MIAKQPKPKACHVCKTKYTPRNIGQKVCGIKCANTFALKTREAEEKKQHRARKQALKPTKDHIKDAQMEFNRFIRARDHDQPCISCGRFVDNHQWDCGHYKTRGGFPELRFEELNAHRQCKSCNGGSYRHARKGAIVSEDYRTNLIARIGIDKVEWLEGPHDAKNYTKEEAIAIKLQYRKKWRQLEKHLND